MDNNIMQETCRICKKTKPYDAAQYPLKNGVACADCSTKASDYFHIYYDNYTSSRPTPKQIKDNMAFMKTLGKRYETFDPQADSCIYTMDTMIMVDFLNHMIAFFPTDCSTQRVVGDIVRFREARRCEIFMFEDLKEANVLDSVNSQERFIMVNLKTEVPGYSRVVLTQRSDSGEENATIEDISSLLGYVLQSRRQK